LVDSALCECKQDEETIRHVVLSCRRWVVPSTSNPSAASSFALPLISAPLLLSLDADPCGEHDPRHRLIPATFGESGGLSSCGSIPSFGWRRFCKSANIPRSPRRSHACPPISETPSGLLGAFIPPRSLSRHHKHASSN
jgi:hypothetical protein